MHPHLSGDVAQDDMAVLQFYPECSVRQSFDDLALKLDDIFLRHSACLTGQRPTTLEIRLLEKALVLVGHDVSLNLRHEIHSHHHDDQERCSTEVERHLPLQDQKLRQQANQCDVPGTNQRQPHQNLVDVARRLLTWANPGHKGTALLEVIRRFLRIEHKCRIEETEEDDRAAVQQGIDGLPG